MAGIPERQSWPDLLGKRADYAKKVIEQDRPDLRVEMKNRGEPEPPIEELDRVIIWTSGYPFYYVVEVPTQG